MYSCMFVHGVNSALIQVSLPHTEMKDSMSKRDLQRLEKAVSAAEKEGFDKKLGLQFQMAKKVLEQLRRIEKLRHAILDLDQKTIAELKSYSSPPDGVYEVMAATFLLLGNTEKELKVRA